MCEPKEYVDATLVDQKIDKILFELDHLKACHPKQYKIISPVLLAMVSCLRQVSVELKTPTTEIIRSITK